MARSPLIRTNEYPYHIYARSNNKENFFIDIGKVWDIMASEIRMVSDRYQACVHAFVLMLNHFHMLITTPRKNIDEIMHYWMREVSKKIGKTANRINHVFGGRYRWSLITNEAYYAHVYRYIYRNPLQRKMLKKVEEYPFSSLQMILKKNLRYEFPLFDDEYISLSSIIPKNIMERLNWLNTPYNNEQNEMIRRGLKRNIFDLSKQNRLKQTRRSLLEVPKVNEYLF